MYSQLASQRGHRPSEVTESQQAGCKERWTLMDIYRLALPFQRTRENKQICLDLCPACLSHLFLLPSFKIPQRAPIWNILHTTLIFSCSVETDLRPNPTIIRVKTVCLHTGTWNFTVRWMLCWFQANVTKAPHPCQFPSEGATEHGTVAFDYISPHHCGIYS